jgi:hypothetical protein
LKNASQNDYVLIPCWEFAISVVIDYLWMEVVRFFRFLKPNTKEENYALIKKTRARVRPLADIAKLDEMTQFDSDEVTLQ